MPPSSVTPAKYCSMSATVTGSLATATTSRWGWEIVQWTGMGRKVPSRRRGGHCNPFRQLAVEPQQSAGPDVRMGQRPEDLMNNRDETIREKLLDRLATLGVDA